MGDMYINQFFPPDSSVPDGSLLIDCTFQAPVNIGGNSKIVNGTFRCTDDKPPSQVGGGSVVDGGKWECVIFNNEITNADGGGNGAVYGKGGEYKHTGQIVTADGVEVLADKAECSCNEEWDTEVKEQGYKILNGGEGVEVNIIECEG